MQYFQKRRLKIQAKGKNNDRSGGLEAEDPLNGVANLFDLGLVFIVGLIFILFSAYHLQDLFNKNSKLTIIKKSENSELEIITKKGKNIEARKISKKKAQGRGERLGTAYRLEDGSMIYVPDE